MTAENNSSVISGIFNSFDKPAFRRDLLNNEPNAQRYLASKLSILSAHEHAGIGSAILYGLSSGAQAWDRDTQLATGIVFKQLDFEGMDTTDLDVLCSKYFQTVRSQTGIPNRLFRPTSTLLGIGMTLLPRMYATKYPAKVVTETRKAWERGTSDIKPVSIQRTILDKVERIIDSLGLAILQPLQADFFIQLYFDNPDISPAAVQQAIIAHEETEDIYVSESAKVKQLVFLYRNLKPADITRVTGLTKSQVATTCANLIEQKLIERPNREPKEDPEVAKRRDLVAKLRLWGIYPDEISVRLAMDIATVYSDLSHRKNDLYSIDARHFRKKDPEVEKRRDTVIKLRNSGLLPTEIKSRLGIELHIVNNDLYLRRDEITVPSGKYTAKRIKDPEIEKLRDTVVALDKAGYKPREIANRLGIPANKVSQYLYLRRKEAAKSGVSGDPKNTDSHDNKTGSELPSSDVVVEFP